MTPDMDKPVQTYSDEGTVWEGVGLLGETRRALLAGIAEILELPTVTRETALEESNGWGSLAVVCIIALLDEKAGIEVDGEQLAKCDTVGDVLKLAGVE